MRETSFYIVQFLCSILLCGGSFWYYTPQLTETQELEFRGATLKYLFILILNGAMLLKLLSEVLGLKPESKELYVAMFFRNFVSMISFALGMIVLGNLFHKIDNMDITTYIVVFGIPGIALISDIMNTNENLENDTNTKWTTPEKTKYFAISLGLYGVSVVISIVAAGLYIINSESSEMFDLTHWIMYIAYFVFLLPRGLFIFFANKNYKDREPSTWNLILLSYIFDVLALGLISFLLGMVERLPRSYVDKEILVQFMHVSVGLYLFIRAVGIEKA